MKVLLSHWHETADCLWCQKARECVTVDFDDGFIRNGTLCFGCLQKTIRVKTRAVGSSGDPPKPPAERPKADQNPKPSSSETR